MKRLLLTLAGVCLLCTASILSAQPPTSGNITATVAAPNSVECSAPFNTTITLSGFDVQDPGVADIVFVLDESGSIPSSSFAQMKTFVNNVINVLMPAAGGGARVGIAMFSNTARRIIPLTDTRQNALNAVNSIIQRAGSTCIGCGITEGRNIFAFGPARPEATQFMVVLTDGQNSVNTAQFPGVVQSAHDAGITLLAIGVGPSVDVSEINFIASDVAGVQTAFLTPDFAQLSTIVNSLTAAITSPGATNVTVDIDVMPRFPVSGATASAGAVNVMGSSVIWTMPSLGSGAQTLTLNHQHDGTGNGPLQIFTADYLDAEGHMVAIATPSTTVTGCNTAPVANAGPDQSVDLLSGSTVTVSLNGSGSTDDGLIQPLSYAWSGPVSATGVTPSVTLPFGVHTFELTVSDGEFTDTDTVTITVNDPTPPVITHTVSGTIVNGWYTSDVQITFSAVDPQSGIASSVGCAPVTLSTDTPGQTFTCTATNGAGATSSDSVTVRRDATAPEVGNVTPSVSSLWPANHRMVSVTVSAPATDASGAECSISNVTSSEPDNGAGDGDTANDIVITGPLSVELRAERSGNGPGRVYTIDLTCTDGAGNSSTSSTTVSVPKSNGK